MYSPIQNLFAQQTSDYRFLTVRGKETEQAKQKIDYVHKMCSKISNTYFIVRERNKQNQGYHFHAIVKVDKEPTRAWYKKGLHIHFKRIARPDSKVGFTIPHNLDITGATYVAAHPAQDASITESHNDQLINRAMQKMRKASYLQTCIERCLVYMSKEAEMPIKYHDYLLIHNGKSQDLPI